LPHAPQLLLFDVVSTHAPPQLVVPGSQRQLPPEQYEPPKQMWLHEPQLSLSSCVFVHEPLHSTVPVGQFDWQNPKTQVSAALHVMPQPPQLAGSVSGSMHPVGHGVRPPLQRHVPVWHDCPGKHTSPQVPQLVRSVCRFVQIAPHIERPPRGLHAHMPR